MGNSHAKNMVVNGNHGNQYYGEQRPHSALGYNDASRMTGGHFLHHVKSAKTKDKGKAPQMPSGRPMLPPLPRSHSFHQILRPTENGVNLAQKGTIRGFGGMCETKLALLAPKASQVTAGGSDDHHHPVTAGGDQSTVNPELIAILKNRRCRSETNLISEDPAASGGQDGASHQATVTGRKGLSSGVAAKISKCKTKAPAPPPPSGPPPPSCSSSSTQSHQHCRPLSGGPVNGHFNQAPPMTSRMNNSLPAAGNQPGNRWSMNEMVSPVNGDHRDLVNPLVKANNATNLARRQSDRPYMITRAHGEAEPQRDHQSRPEVATVVPMIPRLKLTSAPGPPSPPGPKQDRNLVFDSKQLNGHKKPPIGPPSKQSFRELNQIREQLSKKSSRSSTTSSQNDHIQSFLDELEMSFSRPRNHPAAKEEERTLFSGRHQERDVSPAGHRLVNPVKPLLDDNFILRRATPTAGLNAPPTTRGGGKGVTSPKNSRSKGVTHSRPLPFVERTRCPAPGDKDAVNRSTVNSNRSLGESLKTLGHHQHECQPQHTGHHLHPIIQGHQHVKPPTPSKDMSKLHVLAHQVTDSFFDPTANGVGRANLFTPMSSANGSHYHQEHSGIPTVTSTSSQFHSYISDSANYSEEDEDEIRIVLRPRLPPPRRPPLLPTDRPTEDIFTQVAPPPLPLLGLKGDLMRNQCWTPMEDLSSSDEDDGINCDQPSDEYETIPARTFQFGQEPLDLISNGRLEQQLAADRTRFTLQNQLRTLIQGNKLRHQIFT
ncbi:hypothetical protein HDE_05846 [Halotydeus destructor]|nr:hypothetical protein HDE_05846 [Halotydeus destructor]